MNRYEALARAHWERQRPVKLATLTDPDAFFARVAAQLEDAIQQLTRRLIGPARPGESTLQRVRRVHSARFDAESIVLRKYLAVSMSEKEQVLARQVPLTD